MAVIGLITARGGSRSIPKKNIADCAGKPLLAYTCDAALGSARLDRVILSTDSEEIAEVGRRCAVEVPFLRPAELAADTTSSHAVVAHALDWLEREAVDVAAMVLLQPTSPLRKARHIDEAVDLLFGSGAATVVSVVRVPHNFHPQSLMRLRSGQLLPLEGETVVITRRQELGTLYARNGPAVLVTRPDVVRGGLLYGEPTTGYVMDPKHSLDVDSPLDLRLAECLLQRGSAK